jgi:hypothetical protein
MSLLSGWDSLQDDNNGSKTSFTKFNAGEITQIRCLTNVPVVRWSHFIPSAKRSVTCLGTGCPVCDARELAKSQGVDCKFNTSKKFAIVIYNYKTEQVEILEQGKAFFEQLHSFHTEIACAVSEFDKEIEGDLPDLSKQFAPPTKEQMLALMDGKSAQDVFGNKQTDEDEKFEV